MKRASILIITLLLAIPGVSKASDDNLGMFKGRKVSELPDNYREINTPAKLKAFQDSLEVVPSNASEMKMDGEKYRCIDRGGYDLMSGVQVTDLRCWKQK